MMVVLFGFAYSAFLNGHFLGSGQGNSTVAQLTNIWDVMETILKIGEDNVLTVIQGITASSSVFSSADWSSNRLYGVRLSGS